MTEAAATLAILCYPADFLREKATLVLPTGLVAAREFALQMLATMRKAEGVGLAAIQVGDDRRIIVIDVTGGEEEPLLLANPRIETRSKETHIQEEGCLSIPDVRAPVKRSAAVTAIAQNLTSGEEIAIAATELLAVCLQHEIDHLDGVLFIDHLSRLRRSRLLNKYKKARLNEDEE